jgi:histidinol dehydrogenase
MTRTAALPLLLPTDPNYRERIEALRKLLESGGLTAGGETLDVPGIVSGLLTTVRTQGDAGAARLASELDRAELTAEDLRVTDSELDAAHAAQPPELMALMRRAIANIRAYQEHILVRAPEPLVRGGRRLGVRYRPIDRVGVYVPGGKALYPSTVLMTVVPALVAGVPEVVMTTPAPGGKVHPLALALARELGVREVYRLGGAVGIAALAYGTERILAVQKIVGPGNAFVAEAKRQLFGRVGIDSIAGPSEVFIVADDSADPRRVAADLLAQAEHNPGSAILATPSLALAEATQLEVSRQLEALEREEVTRPSLERYGALIVTESLSEAVDLANSFATEHLQVVTRDNERCLADIRHAGAIFIGPDAPVPLGDYYAGPSHVLPTGGTAKFFGPLSCNDFVKASSLIEYDAQSIAEDGADIIDFATHEGLTAHANAIRVRLKS